MNFKSVLPLAAVFLLLLSACQDEKPDAPSFDGEQLVGRWEIAEAFRNGKKTETLTNTFYEFDDRGNMKTNLTPTATAEEYRFNFDGTEIKQKGGAETTYKVESLSDSTLTMSMKIQKFPFRLVLAKVPHRDSLPAEKGILQ